MLANILNLVNEGTNTVNRDQLLRYVNVAAQELWSEYDLPGTTDELNFTLTNSPQYITLPWYVYQVRAVKDANLAEPGELKHPFNKFQQSQTDLWGFNWEISGTTPLHTPLSTTTQLQADIVVAQSNVQSVIIAGPTSNSSFVEETLQILPGETKKTSTNAFTGKIQRISKIGVTSADVLIKQASNSAQVSLIPNRLENVVHSILKVGTRSLGSSQVKVYYKRTFVPLYYDHDVFINDDFEQVLAWKARAYKASLSSEDPSRMQQWITLEQKARRVLSNVVSASVAGQQRAVQWQRERLAPASIMKRTIYR